MIIEVLRFCTESAINFVVVLVLILSSGEMLSRFKPFQITIVKGNHIEHVYEVKEEK